MPSSMELIRTPRLQDLINKYIDNLCLCPNCGLPETDYKIKSECIYHKCAACGAKEMVDMSHKLCTFILAQDKKAKKEAKVQEKRAKTRMETEKGQEKEQGQGTRQWK